MFSKNFQKVEKVLENILRINLVKKRFSLHHRCPPLLNYLQDFSEVFRISERWSDCQLDILLYII